MLKSTNVHVVSKAPLGANITRFTFQTAHEPQLGPEPGAHLNVHLPGDLIRSYSLIDWDEATGEVSVAVKLEPDGRGGSIAMHALEVGDVVAVSGPRNNFPLDDRQDHPVLVAGGIGVTPLYSMARSLKAKGRPFTLHYLVRSRSQAVFAALLEELGLGDRLRLHCDDVDGFMDFEALVRHHPADAHYYVCGPEPMLTAVQRACAGLGRGTVHFERFSAAPAVARHPDQAFEVVLDTTGAAYQVPEDKSILQVLKDAGHAIDYSCGEGTCGTCITDVLEGEIDHRDSILTQEEKLAGDCLCICVSRARSGRLVLDL
ncbi:PDR/VanB family oxidoreductase [Streptomyces sp. NPDC046909]|uniref:PDR/VanB family oxidoreductase n=1 Tax=Streptomyces sp. NPDC046909 TaxID=3155617 RepID=UPI0033EAF050